MIATSRMQSCATTFPGAHDTEIPAQRQAMMARATVTLAFIKHMPSARRSPPVAAACITRERARLACRAVFHGERTARPAGQMRAARAWSRLHYGPPDG